MTSLTRYENQGLELLIDTNTGETFASQNAIARMLNKDSSDSGLRRFLKGLSKQPPKTAEVQTRGGLQAVSLYNEDTIFQVFAKFNPELLIQCAKAGIRVYLHRLAGFEVKSTAIASQYQLPQSFSEALILAGKLQQEKELLEAENALLEQQNEHLSEVVDELFDYSSIVRIAKFNKVHESIFKWQRLKAVSKKMGIEIKKAPDARYEFKNLYSHDVWRVAYPSYKLPETTTLVISKQN